jgi:hypothetical protein
VAAYWARIGESGLAVLTDGRVAALELEGIDGELATSGASQLCRDFGLSERAEQRVSDCAWRENWIGSDLAKSMATWS